MREMGCIVKGDIQLIEERCFNSCQQVFRVLATALKVKRVKEGWMVEGRHVDPRRDVWRLNSMIGVFRLEVSYTRNPKHYGVKGGQIDW